MYADFLHAKVKIPMLTVIGQILPRCHLRRPSAAKTPETITLRISLAGGGPNCCDSVHMIQ
jgi:hypothetical protein